MLPKGARHVYLNESEDSRNFIGEWYKALKRNGHQKSGNSVYKVLFCNVTQGFALQLLLYIRQRVYVIINGTSQQLMDSLVSPSVRY